MKSVLLLLTIVLATGSVASSNTVPNQGLASWYGEEHRGKFMANGKKFDPDKLTAASWFFPLGTKVRVETQTDPRKTVVVTITDRGPARRLVDRGRIIDLSHAAFKELADPDLGLISIRVEAIE